MQLHIGKSAITAGATSNANRFLQYPVMSTLRPAYPRGPWHYKDMHQLLVTTRALRKRYTPFFHRLSNPPTGTASPSNGAT